VRIGVTGHQTLSSESLPWVTTQIDELLGSAGPRLVGVTSLAIGADQLFAQRVLACGGQIYAVIPHSDYSHTFKSTADRQQYEALLAEAKNVETLTGSTSPEEAYLMAGQRVVDLSDAVLAIWDGKPAAGKGGTGDAVEYAVKRGVRVFHLDPITQTALEL
jgi:hypothetical protein